ncbi:MAG: DUF2124 family protein [Desulfobacteraceae bacterium]|jgi:hypothetical protein
MEKKIISTGEDHTSMLTIFRELILESGVKAQDNVIFAGCSGPCYSMATFFGFAIRDLDVNLYFAVDSDIQQLWRLDEVENLGIVATRIERPVKAKVIVLMSALCAMSIEPTLELIKEALVGDGVIIGETVEPGLFERQGWDKRIPLNFLFEFSMENPTSFEVNS